MAQISSPTYRDLRESLAKNGFTHLFDLKTNQIQRKQLLMFYRFIKLETCTGSSLEFSTEEIAQALRTFRFVGHSLRKGQAKHCQQFDADLRLFATQVF